MVRRVLSLTPTFLLLTTMSAFAGDDIPILGIFERLLVMGANLWGVLTWVIPVILLGSTIMTAIYFLRKEQMGTSAVTAGIGIFLAIMLGFAMYKATPAVKKFAENVGKMSTEVIDLDNETE